MEREQIMHWEEIKEALQEDIIPPVYATWIDPLKLRNVDEREGEMTIAVGSEFWLFMLERYMSLIELAAREVTGRPVKIKYVIEEDGEWD